MNKSEYLETKLKRDQLHSKILDFEGGFKPFDEEQLFMKWKRWNALSPTDRDQLKKGWDAYYKTCHDSFYGQKMRGAAEAKNDPAAIAVIVAEVKSKPFPFTTKPSSIDPEELEMKMQSYWNAKNRLEKLNELVGTYESVYEPRKKEVDGI